MGTSADEEKTKKDLADLETSIKKLTDAINAKYSEVYDKIEQGSSLPENLDRLRQEKSKAHEVYEAQKSNASNIEQVRLYEKALQNELSAMKDFLSQKSSEEKTEKDLDLDQSPEAQLKKIRAARKVAEAEKAAGVEASSQPQVDLAAENIVQKLEEIRTKREMAEKQALEEKAREVPLATENPPNTAETVTVAVSAPSQPAGEPNNVTPEPVQTLDNTMKEIENLQAAIKEKYSLYDVRLEPTLTDASAKMQQYLALMRDSQNKKTAFNVAPDSDKHDAALQYKEALTKELGEITRVVDEQQNAKATPPVIAQAKSEKTGNSFMRALKVIGSGIADGIKAMGKGLKAISTAVMKRISPNKTEQPGEVEMQTSSPKLKEEPQEDSLTERLTYTIENIPNPEKPSETQLDSEKTNTATMLSGRHKSTSKNAATPPDSTHSRKDSKQEP